MNDFIERLILEEKELGERIARLNEALNKDGFAKKVGDYQFELLSLQHSLMIAYRRILNIRIQDLKKQ